MCFFSKFPSPSWWIEDVLKLIYCLILLQYLLWKKTRFFVQVVSSTTKGDSFGWWSSGKLSDLVTTWDPAFFSNPMDDIGIFALQPASWFPQCLLSCRMKVQLQLLCQVKIRRVSIWIGSFCKVLRRWSWTSQEAKVDPPGNQDIISHLKVAGKMIVLFHRLDMLVPRRVVVCLTKRRFGSRCFSWQTTSSTTDHLGLGEPEAFHNGQNTTVLLIVKIQPSRGDEINRCV